MSNITFPLQFDAAGRTASAADDDHVRQMIELLLFTAPGQRVNRPDFGAGLLQQIFGPNGPEVASALEFSLKAALERWLGDVIDLKSLDVSAEDSTLRLIVGYIVRRSNQSQTLDITRTVPTQ
jgi:uncharacterized protein